MAFYFASCPRLRIRAVVALFLLPDYPHSRTGSAMWTMTEDMRRIAEVRIIADRTSDVEAKSGIWYGLKLSLADYKLWLIVCINITISAAYGFSNFYPAIVRGFGYSRTTTLVMTFHHTCLRQSLRSLLRGTLTGWLIESGISLHRSPWLWPPTLCA